MDETTTKKPAAPPHPLSAETEKYLATMREQLSASGLGHLGRRFEMAARDAQETIDSYGSKVFTGRRLGTEKVMLPVKTTVAISMRVECNGATVGYEVAVGATPTAGAVRHEAPLSTFGGQPTTP